MIKSQSIALSENFDHLIEEIKAIVSEAHNLATIQMISAKYMIGQAITSHELYKKHAKTQSALYEAIGESADMRPDTIADCVKLYETHPKKEPREIAEQLFLDHGAWRNVRAVLYGGNPNAIGTSLEPDRKHCSKCKNCDHPIKDNTCYCESCVYELKKSAYDAGYGAARKEYQIN